MTTQSETLQTFATFFLETGLQFAARAGDQKRKLIAIIINGELSHYAKITALKSSLLSFQVSTMESNTEINPADLKSLSSDDLKFLTTFIVKNGEEMKQHSDLLDKIGNVLRSQLDDGEKLDLISDLLL
jgi:hypothetical protein